MMKLFRALSLVVAASLGAVGLQQLAPLAKAAMWQWSTTASSNATADPSINWSEGMSPSSVNDSARAMMAVLAAWRNDVSAVTATTGTSTAYALTSAQGSFSPASTRDGFIIGFIPNVTNGAGGTTINVDATSAKPLRTQTATALAAGALVAGSKYHAAYKFSTDEWLLFNAFPSQFEVPLGALVPFTGDTAPNSNFIIPIGQCISRTTYATYFAQVSTRFGTCDGVTTFGAPDLRGRGAWGTDTLVGGAAANRITAAGCTTTSFQTIGDTCGAQTRTLSTNNIPILTSAATQTSAVGAQNFGLFTGGTFAFSVGGNSQPVMADSAINVLQIPSLTVNGASTNAAVQTVNPVIGVNWLLRVL